MGAAGGVTGGGGGSVRSTASDAGGGSAGFSFSARFGNASSEGSSVFGRGAATSAVRGGGGSTARSGARSGRGGGSGRAAFGGAFSSALGVGAGAGGAALAAAGAFAGGADGSGLPREGVAGTRFTMYTFDWSARELMKADRASAAPKHAMCARKETARNPYGGGSSGNVMNRRGTR